VHSYGQSSAILCTSRNSSGPLLIGFSAPGSSSNGSRPASRSRRCEPASPPPPLCHPRSLPRTKMSPEERRRCGACYASMMIVTVDVAALALAVPTPGNVCVIQIHQLTPVFGPNVSCTFPAGVGSGGGSAPAVDFTRFSGDGRVDAQAGAGAHFLHFVPKFP